MYKQILVAVDRSPVSERALKEAVELARQMDARLRLVHVVDTSRRTTDSDGATDKETLLEQGSALLARVSAKAGEAGLAAEVGLIETGNRSIAATLAEEAGRWSAHLIVMGTNGRTGFSYLLSGSVAEELIRLAKAPLLLMSPGTT